MTMLLLTFNANDIAVVLKLSCYCQTTTKLGNQNPKIATYTCNLTSNLLLIHFEINIAIVKKVPVNTLHTFYNKVCWLIRACIILCLYFDAVSVIIRIACCIKLLVLVYMYVYIPLACYAWLVLRLSQTWLKIIF